MAKRKSTGGYPISSDDSSDIEILPPTKKQHVTPLSSQSTQTTRTFQHPTPSAPPWSSSHSQPKSTNAGLKPDASVEKTLEAGEEVAQSQRQLVFERKLDELLNDIRITKDAILAAEKRYESIDRKLDLLIEAANNVTPAAGATNSQPVPSQSSTNNETATFSNPLPTPGLQGMVINMCSSDATRARYGTQKDNAVKAFIRAAFQRTLDIPSTKRIRPVYFKVDGSPDFFPEALKDKKTGYCTPCPHWGRSLSDQVEWIPTYLERFRAMIPKDDDPTSIKLRDLSDRQVIMLMHDGPFNSGQDTWRDMKRNSAAAEKVQAETPEVDDDWLDKKPKIRVYGKNDSIHID
ncbi:hypothetical protein FRC07_008562 [Ceratobasidium sp. 392]|nr:hypothetical protein FRC07_008562 [Ceratobasidium sp. 392]